MHRQFLLEASGGTSSLSSSSSSRLLRPPPPSRPLGNFFSHLLPLTLTLLPSPQPPAGSLWVKFRPEERAWAEEGGLELLATAGALVQEEGGEKEPRGQHMPAAPEPAPLRRPLALLQ